MDIDGGERLETLPVDEENPDPDRLARPAMDCANRVELDVLDCKRIVFWLEGGAGVDWRGEVGWQAE